LEIPVLLTENEQGAIVPRTSMNQKVTLMAVVHFREVNGRVDVSQVNLISREGGPPITADVWRRVRIGDVFADARSKLSAMAGIVSQRTIGQLSTYTRELADNAIRHPGRPRDLTDDHLREVAEVYVAAKITQPRHARQAVTDHFKQAYPDQYGDLGAPNDHRVKSWIQAATNRGLIPRGALK
jgi:hypothetical protein